MQQDINPYNPEKFEIEFSGSEIEQKIKEIYKCANICYSLHYSKTPREDYATSTFSAVPFYYINKIVNKDTKVFGDIGCGANGFKDFYPMLVGIDPHHEKADKVDFFDEDFSKGHVNFFDSAFTINAIHGVSLIDVRKRVMQFVNIIKLGGMGYIALNVSRMLESTSDEELNRLFKYKNNFENPNSYIKTIDLGRVESYVRQELEGLLDYKVFNLTIIESEGDNALDGNIHLVFQK
jgi:hypothetical protein